MKKFLRQENGSDLERKIERRQKREEQPEAEVLASEMGVLPLLPLVVVVAALAALLPPNDDNQICSQDMVDPHWRLFHVGAGSHLSSSVAVFTVLPVEVTSLINIL